MPARSTASRARSRVARSSATGFSQNAAAADAAANSTSGAWLGVDVAITSASTPDSNNASGVASALTPSSSATRRARSWSASVTDTETPSRPRRVWTWWVPILPSPTTPTASSLLKASHVEHHGLQVAHVEHRVAAADPAPAALRARSSSERLVRLPVVGRVVDDDVADAQAVDEPEGAFEARRVDGRLEPEMRIVRDGERLVVGLDADQRDDRAERLLLVDQRVDADVGDDGRLVVEAGRAIAGARAAEHDVGTLVDGILEVPVHLRRRRLVVHRTDHRGVVEGIPETPLGRRLQHFVEEGVVHPFVHEDALGRAANLACAEEAAEDCALRGALEVGVLADDHGPVA